MVKSYAEAESDDAEGVEVKESGTLDCKGTSGRGFIRIHPQNPFSFATEDGTAFFPMGETCYGLNDDSPITDALRAKYLETRRSQNFNFVRMHIGGSYAHAQKDPASQGALRRGDGSCTYIRGLPSPVTSAQVASEIFLNWLERWPEGSGSATS